MSGQGFNPNSLYYGDCLDWMRQWEANCVDLIYLDPPFNSNANYSVLFGTAGNGDAQYRAFDDTWHWDDTAQERYQKFLKAHARRAHNAIVALRRLLGDSGMLAYLTYMAERLEQMRRILKPTGSIYLHCDQTAGYYLRIVMDAVFGKPNFLGDIIWNKRNGVKARTSWGNENDNILCYAKTIKKHTFNIKDPLCRMPYSETSLSMHFKNEDEDGRRYRKEKRGQKTYIYYADEGRFIGNIWNDIPSMAANSPILEESMGYPTQKPLNLLRRIIKASSNEGDVVLDPFCGCGTAVLAADRLDRRWAGIDISSFAIDLVRKRMNDESIETAGIPADLASARKLAKEKPFDFESWAIMRLPGFVPNTKQVADGGIDGRGALYDKPENWDSDQALAQVKGGRFNIDSLRAFISVVNNSKAAVGCFITMDPVKSRNARSLAAAQETVTVRGQSYKRINLWSIADYFDNRPCILPPMANPYTGERIEGTLF